MSDAPSPFSERTGARFGVFEVDLRTGELRKAGIRIRLQDQPFLVLAALLDRPGELVTREELRGRLWSDVSFMDFDHGINVAVKKLRAALNDSVDSPHYIETLGSKGYRFIAAVELRRAASADIDPPSAQPQATRSRHLLAINVVTAALLLGGLAVWLLASREPDRPSYRFRPLATEAAEETWPAWSPDGKTVAYLVPVKGVSQIFTRTLGSPTSVQITKSLHNCDSLFWHPGASSLYYTSEGRLWSISAAGGEPQIVIKDAVAGTISPDGKTLATIRGGDGPDASLWLSTPQDTAGKRYQQAPFPKSFREGAVASFSPDGSKIGVALGVETGGPGYEFWIIPFPSGKPRRAIASATAHAPLSGFSWMPDSRYVILGAELPGVPGSHLYSVDTEKSTVVQVTSGTSEEAQPSVSPDGKSIAFMSGGTDFDLIDVPLEGGPIRTLLATSRNELAPAWSPSGGQYVYTTNANGTEEIWLRALEDGWARPVVATGAQGLPAWYLLGRPLFSPDGTRIVYNLWGLNHSVWISALGGGRPVRVEPDSLDQHGPSWSPDGNWIAYAHLQAGKWALVKTPIGGGPPITLREGAFTFHTKWSPSGEWICYSNQRGLQLVSSDGKAHKVLNKSTSENFDFSKDGATLYYLNPRAKNWEVIAIDLRNSTERKISELAIPSTTAIGGFSLNPNGKSFATSVGTAKFDIWLLEDFDRPGRGWFFRNTQVGRR